LLSCSLYFRSYSEGARPPVVNVWSQLPISRARPRPKWRYTNNHKHLPLTPLSPLRTRTKTIPFFYRIQTPGCPNTIILERLCDAGHVCQSKYTMPFHYFQCKLICTSLIVTTTSRIFVKSVQTVML